MKAYIDLVKEVLQAPLTPSRNGNTYSLIGPSLKVSLIDGLPILTTRKIFWHGVVGELKAFISGTENVKDFQELGCNYWDIFATRAGKLPGIYGKQWRKWGNTGKDQLLELIGRLQNPAFHNSRRLMLQSYNPEAQIVACHCSAQFIVRGKQLSCIVFQRSVDIAVGLPSDILLYGLLTILLAKASGLSPKTLIFHFGDAHIYEEHERALQEQITREPYPPPLYVIEGSILEDFELIIGSYMHHPSIYYHLKI